MGRSKRAMVQGEQPVRILDEGRDCACPGSTEKQDAAME